jgi:hypothetical protein
LGWYATGWNGNIMTNLLEDFRPKNTSEIVGNETAIQRVKAAINTKKPCIIYGDSGIGKTTTVYAIANELGFKVVEKNASDERREEEMRGFLRQIQSNTFVPTIFLLDEVDGADDFSIIEECLQLTMHPLVLIANDYYKLPYKVRSLAEQIRYYNPSLANVVQVIKRIELATGRKADYTRVSTDVRNSILCAFYLGEKYNSKTDQEIVEDFFTKGDITNLNSDHYLWLLDNGEENYKGHALYTFYKLLAVADLTNRFESLKNYKKSKGIVTYPRFIKRLSVLKGGKKK